MSVLALLFAVSIRPQIEPVLWLNPNGHITVRGEEVRPIFNEGARPVKDMSGIAYDFDGTRGGIMFGDSESLQLTGSITVSAWLNLRGYVSDGPGAQILFRGDDRCGVDPYSFVIHGDGTIWFGIQNEQDAGWSVGAEIPLQTWTHVLASFNAITGDMALWLNGKQVASGITSRRPFGALDTAYTPGVSIGNVQNNRGPHNQPLSGRVADLRLYDQVMTPDDEEFRPGEWGIPPRTRERKNAVSHE